MNAVIVIPALNPDRSLIDYVEELIKFCFGKIVIVDDGSDKIYQFIFDELAKKEQCIVLHHQKNKGKGRALKTAFEYCLSHFSMEYDGVITVDSDGQHAVKDVVSLSKKMSETPEKLILGVRSFKLGNVPSLSFWGNKCTCAVIRVLYGQKLTDTQTGLRALSFNILRQFVSLKGERFEYEMNMILVALNKHIPICEVAIQTLYFNHNEKTHFRPIADSYRIYKLILKTFGKYSLASLSSALIDFFLFYLLILCFSRYDLGMQIILATVLARFVSSLYNYFINRLAVFRGNHHKQKTFIKYYSLCFCQMGISALLVYLLVFWFNFSKVAVKICVDGVLFIISYRVQKLLIFKESE